MDTRTHQGQQESQKGAADQANDRAVIARLIQEGQQTIKMRMPAVYESICDKAGRDPSTWGKVRRGLAGQPNQFWAYEAGVVVGTPFTNMPQLQQVGALVAQMGCAHVCIVEGVH